MTKESKPQRFSQEERLLQKYIQEVEQGKETTIRRIRETLSIDSETKPTLEQIKTFVSLQKTKPRHARKRS